MAGFTPLQIIGTAQEEEESSFTPLQMVNIGERKKRNPITAGLSSGVDQIQGLGYSALGGTADLVGADAARDWANEQARRNAIDAQVSGRPDLERIEGQNLGSALPYVGYQIAKQVPTMAAVAGAQFIPGLGQAATATGLTRAAALAPRALGGGGLEAGASVAARRAALSQGEALATGTVVGSGLGFGSLYGESVEGGDPNALRALALAPVYGAAEAVLPAVLRGGLRAPAQFTGNRALRMAKAGGVAGAGESLTELGQTELEMSMRDDLTPEQKYSQRLNAAAAGLLVGGTLGSSGGFAARIANGEEADLMPSSTVPPSTDMIGPTQRVVGPTQPSTQLGDFDPFAAIEARAAAGRPMSQGEQEQLLSSYFAAQKAGQDFQDLMVSQDERLKRVQGIGQQYQDLVGQRGDQMLRAQEVGDMARPITSRLEAEAAQQEAPIISLLNAAAGAETLPGLTKGAGTKADFARIMNPQVMQPTETADVQPPVQRTQLIPQQPAPFSNIRMDAPTQEVGQAAVPLTARPAQVSPPSGAASAVQPTTPVVVGASSKGTQGGTQTAKAVQAKAQGQELSPAESKQLSKLLADAEGEDIGDVLPASVKSGAKAVPGRTRIDQSGLKRIRDALVLGKEVADEKTGRIVDALYFFAKAYGKYSDQGGQALSRRDAIPESKTATQFTDEQMGAVEMQAANVQQALAELGDAVGGNAKDVEAVVRLVKDMVQKKIVSPGSMKRETREELKKLDTMLSQGWNAAKREVFMGKQPDTADIRPDAIRGAIEVKGKGKMPKLVKIAKEGIYAGKDLGMLYDLPGILHYMRTNGTPMERALSLALRESLTLSESKINVKFMKEGKPRFDPSDNTVYLNEEESPEVILHEAFHAALQSFVYKNPNHPAVVQLKKSLKSVVTYKGELTGKALEVQNLLKDLMAKGNELDAVLELVSYSNTLAEFRKALQGMKSDKNIPKSFLESATKAWAAIKQIASRLLGGKASLASDVLQSSLELLDKARSQTAVAGQGQVLEAAVSSESQKAVDAETTTAMDAEAKEAGYADAKEFADKQGAWKTPTQVAFEAIGLGRVNGKDLPLTTKVKENGAKVAQWVRENVPTLERVTLNFNSKFSNGGLVNSAIENFKFDQNTGYLQMERIAQHLQAHPELAKPFLAYMDGDMKALDGAKNSASMQAIADNLRGLMTKYIASLPANSKERRAFENVPFSQYLLHPDSIGQVAGTTMGVAKIGDLLKTETRGETSIDEFKQYLAEREGSVDLKDPLYQLFEEKLGAVLPAGFISKAKYEQMGAAPAGMSVDTSRIWKFDKFDGEKGQYTFESSSTAKQLAENRKVEELSAALLNTTAALSHTYASRNFFNGLLNIGREDGKPTASSVAFDTVDEINATFTGRKIAESSVLKVSDEASRSPQLRWKTQRTGTWVQLPENSPTYGVLQGKIIPGPVWNSMIDMHDRSPLLNLRSINGIMTVFKKSKTVYNPGTHVTNVLSNVSLLILHGINFNTLGRATKMFVQFERNPNGMPKEDLALMKAFYNSGAVLGQFSSTEVKQTVYDKLNAAIEPDSDSSYMTRVKTLMKYEAAKSKVKEYDSKVTEFYAAEDNVFRLAAFLNTAGNVQLRDGTGKLTEQQMVESGAAARDMFLDYDIDARAIRALRQSFLPFVSWPYAAAGVLGRLAIEKPWAMTNMLMSLALISAVTGGSDDEEDRKSAPAYLRDKAMMGLGPYMHMRVPFMGDEQNPVYFNLGKYVPMFSLFQGAPGNQKTLGMELPGFATPGGPFVNAVSALTGYDPFTGKPIAAPTDETWDRVVKTGKYVYDTMTPTLMGTKFWSQVGDLKDEKTGPLGVEKSSLFLARNIGGLGLYQFNTEESRFMQDKQVGKIKKDFSAAMNKAKRNEYSKGYPDYEALDAELDDLQVRLEKRIAEIRGEE